MFKNYVLQQISSIIINLTSLNYTFLYLFPNVIKAYNHQSSVNFHQNKNNNFNCVKKTRDTLLKKFIFK